MKHSIYIYDINAIYRMVMGYIQISEWQSISKVVVVYKSGGCSPPHWTWWISIKPFAKSWSKLITHCVWNNAFETIWKVMLFAKMKLLEFFWRSTLGKTFKNSLNLKKKIMFLKSWNYSLGSKSWFFFTC